MFPWLLQKLWNPFRDWNLLIYHNDYQKQSWLQKLWNPFRDWNAKLPSCPSLPICFKNSETLLGIETFSVLMVSWLLLGFKNSETLLGIETKGCQKAAKRLPSFKNSETLLGIETTITLVSPRMKSSFKNSETLLGIETPRDSPGVQFLALQKLWNPFRDWNIAARLPSCQAAKLRFKNSETLLGIETATASRDNSPRCGASKTLKPF